MEPWHYQAAADLDQPMIERLRRFPRQPDMLVYGLRWLAAGVTRGWLRAYHRLSFVGRENLPAEGSFVMAANHASHLDALCLLAGLPLGKLHRAFPAAAQDYFFVSAPRLFAATVAFNALPFERRLAPRQSLAVCAHVLDNPGNILIIFPEGTRSATGELGEFKRGIGMLLAGRATPVVPCHLEGAHAAWPKGAWLPRPRRITLRIGRPRNYAHLKRAKESTLRICDDLHQAVRELAQGGGR